MKLDTNDNMGSSCNLLVRDFRVWVHIGCSKEEKFHSQLISININFSFRSTPIGFMTDRIEDTICYSEVVEKLKLLVRNKQFNLIEHFTMEVYLTIDDLLIEKRDIISSIKVTIHKVAPPVSDLYGGVMFTYYKKLKN